MNRIQPRRIRTSIRSHRTIINLTRGRRITHKIALTTTPARKSMVESKPVSRLVHGDMALIPLVKRSSFRHHDARHGGCGDLARVGPELGVTYWLECWELADACCAGGVGGVEIQIEGSVVALPGGLEVGKVFGGMVDEIVVRGAWFPLIDEECGAGEVGDGVGG